MSGCFLTSLEVINQSCQRWKKINVRSCSKGHQPFPYSLRAVLIQDSSTAFKVFLFSQSFEAPVAFFFFFFFKGGFVPCIGPNCQSFFRFQREMTVLSSKTDPGLSPAKPQAKSRPRAGTRQGLNLG